MGVEVIEKSEFKIPKGIKAVIKAGFFDGKYSNGESIANVAFWNEFGTFSKLKNRHIPPRPFMRNVANDKAKMQRLANIAKIELEKGKDSDEIAEIIGEQLATMIKMSISQGEFTANAKGTIKRKGSSRPLIDTGLMLGSVSYKVGK